MLSARVGLFVTSFLGFLFAVLSLMNSSAGDVWAGLIISAAGIVGWIGLTIWEECQ